MKFAINLSVFFRYDEETGKLYRIHIDGTLKLAGYPHGDGYLRVKLKNKRYLVHRLAFILQGIDPAGFVVDHIDGNRANNKWSNLRLVTDSENSKNQCIPKNNRSGVIGVLAYGDKWRANIRVDRVLKHLGTFETKDEAILARKSAEAANNFHKNHGRHPNG